MSTVKLKPTSPGRRGTVKVLREGLFKGRPYKHLVEPKGKISGRNNAGRITVRHRGGAHKRHYRIIDFKRTKDGIPGKVERVEYDPNRSAHVALILYKDGERRYIICPRNLTIGDLIESGPDVQISTGNCLPIRNIPVGSVIHCIEMMPAKGAQIARSAGAYAQLLAKDGQYAQIRMRSGEVRKVHVDCRATVGEVGNGENSLRRFGKAGAKRWLGFRPTVRGVVMNPIDHPHGGGEGKTAAAQAPVSPWGMPTKGYKTRRNKRTSGMIIVDRRKRKG